MLTNPIVILNEYSCWRSTRIAGLASQLWKLQFSVERLNPLKRQLIDHLLEFFCVQHCEEFLVFFKDLLITRPKLGFVSAERARGEPDVAGSRSLIQVAD